MRRMISVITMAVALVLAAVPSSADGPTLLQTWVWFEFGGKIAIDDIKQDDHGVVELKKGKYRNDVHIEERTTYAVTDAQRCTIRQTKPSMSAYTLIYLNNFLPGIHVLQSDYGATEFAVYGKEHTHCTTEARGTFCMDQMHFRASDKTALESMKQALNLIFSKFCTFAKPENVPPAAAGWQTTVK